MILGVFSSLVWTFRSCGGAEVPVGADTTSRKA